MVPPGAGSFSDDTGKTARWVQAPGFVSSAEDDVVITARCGASNKELKFTIVQVEGSSIITCANRTTSSDPHALIDPSTLSHPAIVRTSNGFNGLALSDWTLNVLSGGNPPPTPTTISDVFSAINTAPGPLPAIPATIKFTVTTVADAPPGDYEIIDPFGHKEHVIVTKLDLIYSGLPEETLPMPHEEDPGGFICLNDDDDDGNGTPDKDDGGVLTNDDDDLQPISLVMTPVPTEGTVSLTVPTNIKVWKSRKKDATFIVWDLSAPAQRSDFQDILDDGLFIEGFDLFEDFLELTYNRGTLSCSDKVKIIPQKVEFIDDEPDYALDSNNDSDNFFLRQDDDYLDLDIHYRILPAGAPVDDVKINIYQELGTTPIETIPGEMVGSDFKTGDNLHVQWTDARNGGNFRDAGFYRVQLEVFAGGQANPVCSTSIDDADPSTPGWQCPQDGLGIHDLTFKHHPIFKFASGEVSFPVKVDLMMQRSKIYRWEFNPLLGQFVVDPQTGTPVTFSDLNTFNSNDDFMAFTDVNDRFSPPPDDFSLYFKSFPNSSNNYVFIQYWLFHMTSFTADIWVLPPTPFFQWWHEGDWEMSQFTVKLKDPSVPDDKSKWLIPFALTASQHYYGQTLKWEQTADIGVPGSYVNNQDYPERSDIDHPILYIAKNSHAIFFKNGEFTATGTPNINTGFQYEAVNPLIKDTTGSTTTINPDSSQMIFLEEVPIVNNWNGFWGLINSPGTVIPPHGDGPPSPSKRGPAEQGAGVTIQINPKGFHNSFLKTTQGSLSIP